MLQNILSVVFCIICVVLATIVLMQEGNEQGLGSIGGMQDTYWSKNRGRSAEGFLEKLTTFCAVAFLVLAFVLNIIK
jgi:preprotein translocase, secG subunit